jgi:hypothetical protein
MKSEYAEFSVAMNLRLCRVTVTDMEGVKHSAEVTDSTLYEAVALGLVAIREEDWTGEIAEGLNTVEVSAMTVPVTHSVTIQNFRTWLDRSGGTPAGITQRNRVRRIMGLVEKGKP